MEVKQSAEEGSKINQKSASVKPDSIEENSDLTLMGTGAAGLPLPQSVILFVGLCDFSI